MIVSEKAGSLCSLISKPSSFPLTTTQRPIVYFLILSHIGFTILIINLSQSQNGHGIHAVLMGFMQSFNSIILFSSVSVHYSLRTVASCGLWQPPVHIYHNYTWNYWLVKYLAIHPKIQLARFLIDSFEYCMERNLYLQP